MNKTFVFMAITILLLASFIPAGNAIATKENETKTMEVPVKIYTLHGVKEIKKELPMNEAKELLDLFNETRDAVKLMNSHATFKEKMEANAIIDSLLFKMKENGLLGNISLKEAKELITGKYLQKQKNGTEARKIMLISRLLTQNNWQVNAMCGMCAAGNIYNFHPWNFLTMLFIYWAFHQSLLPRWVLLLIPIYVIYSLVELLPHPTTIGFWIIEQSSFYGHVSWIYTFGMFGEKSTPHSGKFIAFTLGFTGFIKCKTSFILSKNP